MDTKKIITHIATFSPLSPGFTYMALSAVSFCFMSVFVKLAGHSLPTIQIVFVRGIRWWRSRPRAWRSGW